MRLIAHLIPWIIVIRTDVPTKVILVALFMGNLSITRAHHSSLHGYDKGLLEVQVSPAPTTDQRLLLCAGKGGFFFCPFLGCPLMGAETIGR